MEGGQIEVDVRDGLALLSVLRGEGTLLGRGTLELDSCGRQLGFGPRELARSCSTRAAYNPLSSSREDVAARPPRAVVDRLPLDVRIGAEADDPARHSAPTSATSFRLDRPRGGDCLSRAALIRSRLAGCRLIAVGGETHDTPPAVMNVSVANTTNSVFMGGSFDLEVGWQGRIRPEGAPTALRGLVGTARTGRTRPVAGGARRSRRRSAQECGECARLAACAGGDAGPRRRRRRP